MALLPVWLTSNRWLSFVFSVYLTACAGTIYIASLYLKELRTDWFHASPTAEDKIEQLVFACNLGNWLPICGFLYDSRIGGPAVTVWVGAFFLFVGYCGLYLSLTGVFDAAYWQLWVLWFLWGHGSGYFDAAAVATSAFNFPRHRGRVIGVVKSTFGLSGSVMTQVYLAFFSGSGHAPEFLLFLGLALPLAGCICTIFVHRVPEYMHRDADNPGWRFALAYTLVLCLALCLMGATLLRAFTPLDGSQDFSFGVLVAVGATLLSLLSVTRRSAAVGVSAGALQAETGRRHCDTLPLTQTRHGKALDAIEPEVGTMSSTLSVSSSADAAEPPAAPTSLTNAHVLDTVRSLNFWLQFGCFLVGCGGGVVVINNMHPIVLAQMADAAAAKRTSDVLVSLLSVFNCLGRMGCGLLSDLLRKRAPRPLFLVAALALMALSHVLLIGARSALSLYLGVCLCGLAYGALWTLVPTLSVELYGLRHFAATYGVFSIAATAASLLYSTELATKVFDAHATAAPEGDAGEGPQCDGDACFRLTHIVVIAGCVAGASGAALLTLRTRDFYMNTLSKIE